MVIDNPKTIEILKRRCGVVFTPAEVSEIEQRNREREEIYKQLDPVLNAIYQLRVILRTRKWTYDEEYKFGILQKKRLKLLSLFEKQNEPLSSEIPVEVKREKFVFEN